jgi:hypothetical protein
MSDEEFDISGFDDAGFWLTIRVAVASEREAVYVWTRPDGSTLTRKLTIPPHTGTIFVPFEES